MSTARFNTLQNAAGTKSVPVETVVDGSAKAWVNFNGTGTVAIRAAFNVTSITDNGIGDYTVNFTNPLPDTNYVAFCNVGGTSGNRLAWTGDEGRPRTASQISITAISTGFSSPADSAIMQVSVFR